MKIFTSLVPRQITDSDSNRQQLAIDSWQKAGFQPVSLNCADEAVQIAELFPQVEVRKVQRDGCGVVGKPVVYVDDLLAAVIAEKSQVSGIVNSDIIFRANVDLPAEMSRLAQKSLVYGCRLDIDSAGDTRGRIYDIGFDYFFLDKKLAAAYPQSGLCMGAPMWDYWMPLICSKLQSPPQFLRNSIAWHISHPQNWDQTINLHMLGELIQHSGLNFGALARVNFDLPDDRGIEALKEFADYILPYLYQHSQMVELAV